MINRTIKVVAALSLVVGLTDCRTTNQVSAIKGDGDVQDGLHVSKGDAEARARWAYRMGITFVEGSAEIAAVAPAKFGSSVGLEKGFVVIALNGRPVTDAESFERVAKALLGLDAGGFAGGWVLRARGANGEADFTAKPGYDCDPYLLVGCGPLIEK